MSVNPIFRTSQVKEACYQVLLGRPSIHRDTWSPTFSDKKYIAAHILNVDPDYLECLDKLSISDISCHLKRHNDITTDNLLQNIDETIVKYYDNLIMKLLEYYDEKLSED